MKNSKNFLQTIKLSKSFINVKALHEVDIELKLGEVHGLIGENGAGKSTLINILSGVCRQDSGSILLNNNEVTFRSPHESIENGIYAVHQELNLVDEMSVLENLLLGQEIVKSKIFPFISFNSYVSKIKGVVEQLGLENINLNLKVNRFGIGIKQLLEIAKGLLRYSKILILDEPTATLTKPEIDLLFEVIKKLKNNNISIVFVSHKINEVMIICDRITVLRNGEKIITKNKIDTNVEELINFMVGRKLTEKFPKRKDFKKGTTALRVEGFTNSVLKNINFKVDYGEIVGIVGIVGAGRTELARALFGLDNIERGKMWIDGKEKLMKSPNDSIKNKIAFLTEERRKQGLMLELDLDFNINLIILSDFSKFGFLPLKRLRNNANKLIKDLNIKAKNSSEICKNLSGGNQQKVVIAKWLNCDANIFIFDEPTRGVDVGAKTEVYELINKMVEKGKAVIFITSEMEEAIGMCDKIIVMREGKISKILINDERNITQKDIISSAIRIEGE